MEPYKPIISFNLGSLIIDIKPEAIIQLVIILLVGILAWYATKDLKSKPQGKKQVIIEYLYNLIKNVVDSNMGKEYRDVIPFIGTLAIFILIMNLTGLVGIAAPTKNFSVTIALSLIVFVFIQAYTVRKKGIKKYFGGYAKPMAVMLPINILERIMLPISLALRLFGNILAATVLVELVYQGLSSLAWIAEIGLPIPLHAYFDIFDGAIQMVIFVMLTMINTKITVEH
ncbi:F-ATPase subunit 6 [uncultured Clostridium sp.]|uniref:F0F1 ATP synthase subunit A n=1 Tax=uncultured Clostridium sp. TaxID=59620 RepID=UPI000820ADBA|nr:F0F1 ATP synthase subunit A [uncultured Clostridium sp.]SCK01554.1 F-ATPase subunit 6 [uncultured Clostridium sp.]